MLEKFPHNPVFFSDNVPKGDTALMVSLSVRGTNEHNISSDTIQDGCSTLSYEKKDPQHTLFCRDSLVLSQFTRFLKGFHISIEQKPSCFCRALNKSNLAFVELWTKVILLSEISWRDCFRRTCFLIIYSLSWSVLVCLGLYWSILVCPKISPRFPLDFRKISPRFPQDFLKIFPRFPLDFP